MEVRSANKFGLIFITFTNFGIIVIPITKYLTFCVFIILFTEIQRALRIREYCGGGEEQPLIAFIRRHGNISSRYNACNEGLNPINEEESLFSESLVVLRI